MTDKNIVIPDWDPFLLKHPVPVIPDGAPAEFRNLRIEPLALNFVMSY
jgi:hypothetical protein